MVMQAYPGCMCIHAKRSVGDLRQAASKKWKASLRVDKGGGVPGRTIGDWLIDAGLDTPKAARPKAPSLNALRRRQGAHMRAGRASDAAAGAAGKLGHREGCLCVICKQARPENLTALAVWA